jgi:hypothetical protein
VPGADGGRGDLVDGDVAPGFGEVVAPQPRVEGAGALAEVVAGEVVLGVLADRPATGVRSPPALAEEVGLLAGKPGPGVGLGAED